MKQHDCHTIDCNLLNICNDLASLETDMYFGKKVTLADLQVAVAKVKDRIASLERELHQLNTPEDYVVSYSSDSTIRITHA